MSTVRARDGVPHGPLVKRPKTPASHAGNTSSNLVRVTKNIFLLLVTERTKSKDKVGVNGDEGPPVPIPNTEVKLISADNTWPEAAREDKAMPTRTNAALSSGIHQKQRCLRNETIALLVSAEYLPP